MCREAAPSLVQAYDKFHDRGVEFISISADDKDTCQQFATAHGMAWPSGYDSDVAAMWNAEVPIVLVIGADGRIAWTDSSSRLRHRWRETPAVLDRAIERALSDARASLDANERGG